MRSRSIRLATGVTSIRLENLFWAVLEQIAAEQNLTMPQLVAELRRIADQTRGGPSNHASDLRVLCLQYVLAGTTPPAFSDMSSPSVIPGGEEI
jgi:predicted DNA-binding ribbon-helix-helix protein